MGYRAQGGTVRKLIRTGTPDENFRWPVTCWFGHPHTSLTIHVSGRPIRHMTQKTKAAPASHVQYRSLRQAIGSSVMINFRPPKPYHLSPSIYIPLKASNFHKPNKFKTSINPNRLSKTNQTHIPCPITTTPPPSFFQKWPSPPPAPS